MSTTGVRAQPASKHIVSLSHPMRMGANIVIIGLWFWLYRPVFDYLAIIFSREDFRTNQFALVGVLALIAFQVYKGHLRLRFDALPQLFPPALALALGGSVLYLLAERFLDVNTLSASLFGLASYGLLGLWMQPQHWREGLPAALLFIGTLPFEAHLQTFVGYPMRVLTASIVHDGLAGFGVPSITTETILRFENSVSQIDLPCSGVKSLWAGAMFLIAVTWIERRRLDFRWLLSLVAFAMVRFAINVARIGTIVVVGQVAGWRLLAEMIHVPLGILGFIAACAAAVVLLHTIQGTGSRMQDAGRQSVARPAWLAPGLAVAIVIMALVYAPRPQTGLSQPPPEWEFPDELVTEPMPLKPDEIAWLTRDGAESADRLRFEWRGVSGSMMLITSTTWRAHHRPERCFEVYGLSLLESRPYLVSPDFPVRIVSLGDGAGHALRTATYWFQSPTRTTADYATRIWADSLMMPFVKLRGDLRADLPPRREGWVLVTILFDDVQDPRAAEVKAFYVALHEAVARGLADR